MKKNLQLLAVLALVTVAIPASAKPPIYMKYDGVDGSVQSRKNGGQIEIESFSWGATNSGAHAVSEGGCTTGPAKFTVKGTPPAEMTKLCQTRGRIGTVVVDIDGVKHAFENASFTGCQTGNGSVPTDQFSLNYTKCTYHRGGVRVAAGDVNNASTAQPNARLIGLPSGPVPVNVETLTLNGTGATLALTKVGTGTLTLSGANSAPLPKLELELTSGPKWTFYQVEIKGIMISSATGARSKPMDQFSLNFAKVEGPVAGYPSR
jgi:type VI secretion system secreted protein Hcp